MKVWVAIVLDDRTKRPSKVEVFANHEEAKQFLYENNSFNMPVEKEIHK